MAFLYIYCMNIMLLGYGKMGKEVEQIARHRGHMIPAVVTKESDWSKTSIEQADVAIDFSHASVAPSWIRKCISGGIPVVSGTTGWLDELKILQSEVIRKEGALFYAPNFSIGVYIFKQLNQFLAEKMSQFEDYKASMVEIHHLQKKDAPSGTAIDLANDLIKTPRWIQRMVIKQQRSKTRTIFSTH